MGVTAAALVLLVAGVTHGGLDGPAAPDATVVVSGTFWSGRGPCQLMPDGQRRWALLKGFTIRRVHRGTVRSRVIGVQPDAVRLASGAPALVEGREYVLFLRPSEESLRALQRPGAPRRSRDALGADEVLAIVERQALEKTE
jgi:hypothetical protein